MDKNYELAELLIETAEELLDESYGAHGAHTKYLEERYKKIKNENDKQDKNADNFSDTKKKLFEKLGYGDKIPKKADRKYEDKLKLTIDTDKKIRKDKNDGWYANSVYYEKENPILLGRHDKARAISRRAETWGDTDDEFKTFQDKLYKSERKNEKINPIHNRINKRAKAQNESIALLLIEAASILNENSDTELLDEVFGFGKNKSNNDK